MTPEEWASTLVKVAPDENSWSVIITANGKQCLLGEGVAYSPSPMTGEAVHTAIASIVRRAVAEALNAGMPGAPLSAENLEDVHARHAATTPGTWLHNELGRIHAQEGTQQTRTFICAVGTAYTGTPKEILDRQSGNATFIASAHQDVPALLAHVDHLQGLLRDIAQDDVGCAYRRGYADGAKEAEELRTIAHGLYETWEQIHSICIECGRLRHSASCRLAKALGLPMEAPDHA